MKEKNLHKKKSIFITSFNKRKFKFHIFLCYSVQNDAFFLYRSNSFAEEILLRHSMTCTVIIELLADAIFHQIKSISVKTYYSRVII